MSTYNGTFNFYNNWKLIQGTVANLASDAFKMLLTTSAYTPNATTHTQLSDITNELSGNGYSRASLTNVTWTLSSGTMKFDFDDPVFTASGGSLTARYWVVFDDTVTNDLLVAYGLLDDTPANVVATDGNTITYNVPAGGFYTLA